MASLHPNPSTWPLTLEDAVERVLGWLSERDKLFIRDTHEMEIGGYHFSLALTIRHTFGLWQGNFQLAKACGCEDADDASSVILHEVRERLQISAPARPIPRRGYQRDEVTEYILKYFRHLLTRDEQLLWDNVEWFVVGGPDDPNRLGLARFSAPLELQDRITKGRENFYRDIAPRILRDHAELVRINRCPICGMVCRTPKSMQCFECGHDWH